MDKWVYGLPVRLARILVVLSSEHCRKELQQLDVIDQLDRQLVLSGEYFLDTFVDQYQNGGVILVFFVVYKDLLQDF